MKLNSDTLMEVLDWAYEKAISGAPGIDSAEEMASDYLNETGSLTQKANSLIRWQNTKAGTSGFLSGLGGAVVMPVAVPANITTVIYVQVRMIAALAYMGGYDLRDDRVKTLVYLCLCGNAAKDVVKEVGIKLGVKLTEQAIKNISREVIVKINQSVGFRLLTKFGEKGVINLGKTVPLVGGVIGATFDSFATNTVGNIARDTFIPA